MKLNKGEIIAFLKRESGGEIVKDTGGSILYAKTDGLNESMYSFPGGDPADVPDDPVEQFLNEGGDTECLAYNRDDLTDDELKEAYEAVLESH